MTGREWNALVPQRFDNADDIFLGPDIHAARWLRQDQDLGMREPFGECNFLLVAAGKGPEIDVGQWRPDLQVVDLMPRRCPAPVLA